MLKSLFYVFLFLLVGETAAKALKLTIPGNVVGMILLFLALRCKMISLKSVKPAVDSLLKHMVLFFIPYGVGLMVYPELILQHWKALGIIVILSTTVTLLITALIYQKLNN